MTSKPSCVSHMYSYRLTHIGTGFRDGWQVKGASYRECRCVLRLAENGLNDCCAWGVYHGAHVRLTLVAHTYDIQVTLSYNAIMLHCSR